MKRNTDIRGLTIKNIYKIIGSVVVIAIAFSISALLGSATEQTSIEPLSTPTLVATTEVPTEELLSTFVIPTETEAAVTVTEIVPTKTEIPDDGVPEYSLDYLCNGTDDACIQETDSITSIITHVIYMEGGIVDLHSATDILQVLHNRMQAAWTCPYRETCHNPEWAGVNPDKVPWGKISRDSFEKLAMFILTQPYTSFSGKVLPAFNGIMMPLPVYSMQDQNSLAKRYYDAEYLMVQNWLENGVGQDQSVVKIELTYTFIQEDGSKYTKTMTPYLPIRRGIQYFYTESYLIPGTVAADSYFDKDLNKVMYICFTSVSGYNADNP